MDANFRRSVCQPYSILKYNVPIFLICLVFASDNPKSAAADHTLYFECRKSSNVNLIF